MTSATDHSRKGHSDGGAGHNHHQQHQHHPQQQPQHQQQQQHSHPQQPQHQSHPVTTTPAANGQSQSQHQQHQSHHHHHHHHHRHQQHHHGSNNNSNSNSNSSHSQKDHHHLAGSNQSGTSSVGQSATSTTMATATTTATTTTTSASSRTPPWDTKQHHRHHPCGHGRPAGRKTESVLSTDSDIRFTRRKLGDSQRCGCAVIAGFLLTLLLASLAIYIGYTYLRPDPLPERVFRAKLRVVGGDAWSAELADQSSMRFQHKQRDYRERINLVVRRSELRDAYEGSEVLALDGSDGQPDLTVHVNLHFDPYRADDFTAAQLRQIFLAEFTAPAAQRRHFGNLTVDASSVHITEVRGDEAANPEAANGRPRITAATAFAAESTSQPPLSRGGAMTTPAPVPRHCEPLRLPYCASASLGYNTTTYPNWLGHADVQAVQADLIAFRELVDAECFRQAFDFVCRLLQPPCELHEPLGARAQAPCREYCEQFAAGCGARLPERFRRWFECERFPEAQGAGSCAGQPGCAERLKAQALSGRLCDGVADCGGMEDETECAYCAPGALHCGRGRACIARQARCDGRVDCPDGSDERDCLSIAPQVSFLTQPAALTPHRARFYDSGYAVFLEKGETGKLCAEGLEGAHDLATRTTVAESLCKSLGYEKLESAEVRNDTEPNMHYVRVLDPRAEEISFVRTACTKRQALFVTCGQLECGISSSNANSLPKMAAAGDWPWHVSLFRDDTHVCDGTLVSADWVLTTESCFQGQPKATWMAVFGAIRRGSRAPWTQRRRIIGMVKSPVEGSTAALIRLETSVAISNFVRPICLSDHHHQQTNQAASQAAAVAAASVRQPTASALRVSQTDAAPMPMAATHIVEHQYFKMPSSEAPEEEESAPETDPSAPQLTVDASDAAILPQAAALGHNIPQKQQLQPTPFRPSMPLQPDSIPGNHHYPNHKASGTNQYQQYQYETRKPAPPHIVQQYLDEQRSAGTSAPPASASDTTPAMSTAASGDQQQQQWTNCQTLGWSRQRDHLQRVQLQIGAMATCENVSIATVNSVCTEALFHQQDCSEEEFAGSPMMCMLPTGSGALGSGGQQQPQQQQQWALVGIASWRIVCAQMGIERPRMYDKIASNTAWIRDTVSSAV